MTGSARYSTKMKVWAAQVCAACFFSLTILPAGTQAVQDRQRDNQTLSARAGQAIMEILELEAEGAWQEAADAYGRLLARDGLSAFERATLLRQRGRAWYELDQGRRTIADWQSAIALETLPPEDENTLRINTGQILMAEGQIPEGIDMIETAIDRGVPLNPDIAMRLAQAHGQLEQLEEGIVYARFAFDEVEERTRGHYTMLQFYLERLERFEEQAELLEEMIGRWPDDRLAWARYAGILGHLERDHDAFDVNTIMYLNGMFSESDEIVRMARYYQAFEYPYRGAVILERELNAGRVEATPDHFRLLAGMWRSAREWDRSLPVLRRVATMTGIGTDFEALGEALYQNGEYQEAETMLRQSLRRGGVNRPGDTWNLIGNTLVEQDRYEDAIHAFEQGLDWEYSRATSQGWLSFIRVKQEIQFAWIQTQIDLAIQECGYDIERQLRSVPTQETRYDSAGIRLVDIETPCTTYYNEYGRLRPEWEPV